MLVIYHKADLDGIASAAIVKKWYNQSYNGLGPGVKEPLRLFGIDYGEAAPVHIITPGEKTFIVDFSFSMDILHELAEGVGPGNLIWCDHHKTAIEEFENLDKSLRNFVAVLPFTPAPISACELVWGYLFPHDIMPDAIKYLGKYDTWRNKNLEEWENQILPFQYAMRVLCKSPETFPPHLVSTGFNKEISGLLAIGKAVLTYQEEQDAYLCKNIAFVGKFCGLNALFINSPGFSSNSWKSIYDPAHHKILVSFHYNGKDWKYSLRTYDESINCAELAAIYRGGGHKKAAGFRWNCPAKEAGFYSPHTN